MRSLLAKLGPGLLYAGAAVGVSHLVQSTRAGASYGLEMVIVVVLANVIKYPFFKAGPLYTAKSGKSILEGISEKGPWAMGLFYLLTLSSIFAVQAVVTLITASVFAHIFDLHIELWQISAGLLLLCGVILVLGHYQWLSKIMKGVILLLTLATFVSLVSAINHYSEPEGEMQVFSFWEFTDVFFLIALVGWMPAPLDISLWHSEWSLAENESRKEQVSIKQTNLDFNIGYWGTTLLAAAFVAMGALILRGRGIELPSSGAAFAGEVIGMYTLSIGDWAFGVIALAAFTTMFSTTLTVLDAYPRVLSKSVRLSLGKSNWLSTYNLWLIITIIGALFVLIFQLENMKQLVDFATTISFLTAPLLASLIFHVSKKLDPNFFTAKEKVLCWGGLTFLYCFSIYYIVVKYFL